MWFLWLAILTFLAILTIRFGIRLWRKEAEARRALSKKVSDDAKALAKEVEGWLSAEWQRLHPPQDQP
jgi:hypothetical protein